MKTELENELADHVADVESRRPVASGSETTETGPQAVADDPRAGSDCPRAVAENPDDRLLPVAQIRISAVAGCARLSFEQMTRESTQAFQAFTEYLGQGANRSTSAVAVCLGKSPQLMRRWSARFRWATRVQDYTKHLATISRKAVEHELQAQAPLWVARDSQIRERRWVLHERALALGEEAISRWLADKSRRGSLEGIARILEAASKLGGEAVGANVQADAKRASGASGLRVEVVLALQKIYGQPLKGELPAPVIDIAAEKGEVSP